MKESAVDVILHPVRMRIIQYLINQQLTAQQLKELLPDIPQATLYRNLKKLVEAEVIHIVDEIPNRGTIEKVYSINNASNTSISPAEVNKLSTDDLMSLFIKFMANLMGEYERYINQEKIDLVNDGVTFRQASMYLSDEEYKEFINDLVAVYSKIMKYEPTRDRRRRTIATIIIPEQKKE
ncbi:helix-turn-helix domain-containing protein [Paenibacillus sp. BSR1-1]|uniref:helix-turn-helix domain-containing protein n=1 Tax=Paenibacillus sp. BSR1-1 TaxID=3020845 RepID=UPI0025B1934A|nr:helix-turn-helix domain-containing protein [Paenibacillus sp. BSR1-1]MDN3018686.1 helix-turn-helix domain-containing protein [Paenibacillus sp. BSR1-1]